MTTNFYLIQGKHNLSNSPNPPISPTFLFAGQSLKLANRACHLVHILRSVLSDTDDILRVQTDMCYRANCLLPTFYAANPAVKTLLFRSFCLSLYMALRYGDFYLPVYVHWKSLSIICWEKSGSFLGIVILASFTALV